MTPPKLLCIDGTECPETIPSDLAALRALPPSAQAAFWEVLEPCLAPAPGADADRAIEAFARQHRAVGGLIAEALRGCRFLMYEAARRDLDRLSFAADLGTLLASDVADGQAESLRTVLLSRYDDAKQRLRREIVSRSIADHGRLLTGADWRVDRIAASQHGRAIDAPVALVTFSYREGSEQKRLTFHAELGMMLRLKQICEQVLQ